MFGKKKIMSVPKYIKRECFDVWEGRAIDWRFWEVGALKINHIPEELEKKGWRPDPFKTYKIWWHSTYPSDPSDHGCDILDYIEEVDIDKYKKYIIKEIKKTIDSKGFQYIMDLAKALKIDLKNDL